jgi:hypothetical protein
MTAVTLNLPRERIDALDTRKPQGKRACRQVFWIIKALGRLCLHQHVLPKQRQLARMRRIECDQVSQRACLYCRRRRRKIRIGVDLELGEQDLEFGRSDLLAPFQRSDVDQRRTSRAEHRKRGFQSAVYRCWPAGGKAQHADPTAFECIPLSPAVPRWPVQPQSLRRVRRQPTAQMQGSAH